jgi:REP element-mobilizing transposase RayT
LGISLNLRTHLRFLAELKFRLAVVRFAKACLSDASANIDVTANVNVSTNVKLYLKKIKCKNCVDLLTIVRLKTTMAKQLTLIKKFSDAYGGEHLRKRKGRTHGRPLSLRNSMHLVLRSTQARKEKSFLEPSNAHKIKNFVKKFATKNHIQVLSLANVGNHLHLHIKLGTRRGYRPFIRALTGAIAVAIGGKSRWTKSKTEKFWDLRPFTRIVQGFQDFLTMKDYLEVNRLQGQGYSRWEARMLMKSCSSRGLQRPLLSG